MSLNAIAPDENLDFQLQWSSKVDRVAQNALTVTNHASFNLGFVTFNLRLDFSCEYFCTILFNNLWLQASRLFG
jgi:hypothetical protein